MERSGLEYSWSKKVATIIIMMLYYRTSIGLKVFGPFSRDFQTQYGDQKVHVLSTEFLWSCVTDWIIDVHVQHIRGKGSDLH